MSLANPTQLKVGDQGAFHDRTYVVSARVVLSVAIKGETYYWNEYYLDSPGGEPLVLSYEEDDTGRVWRLFSDFVPLRPLSAVEAAAFRVGRRVELTAEPMSVTLVQRSRVCHIEGRAPEGIEPWDEADFFNAERAGRMLVVSWTGQEVEYYYGATISGRQVAAAFGLLSAVIEPPRSVYRATAEDPSGVRLFGCLAILCLVGVFLAIAVGHHLDSRPARRAPPPPAQVAGPACLRIGARGRLGGIGEFEIRAHAVVGVSRLHGRFDRHEYLLRGPRGERRLLVNSLTGESEVWQLLSPVAMNPGQGPLQFARMKPGEALRLGGTSMSIFQVFVCQSRDVSGTDPEAAWSTGPQYGLLAREGETWLVAQWTESSARVYRGQTLDAAQVRAAFEAIEATGATPKP